MNPTLASILTDIRQQLEGIYGPRLKRTVLFGSNARGVAEAGADIDILVVLDGQVNPAEEIGRTGAVTAELSLRHDVVISCVFVSSDRYESEQSPFLINIRREGIAA